MKERLKALRDDQGLKRKEFAEKIGISVFSIESYESGRREISERTIDDICRAIPNLNKDWLMTGNGKMYVPITRNQQIYEYANKVVSLPDDNFKKKFLLLLSNLSESDWERFETLFRMLSDDSNKTE